MTRYDYRIKRRLFRQTDIARHQNFNDLEKRYTRRKRVNLVRNTLILIGLILLILILIATARADRKTENTLKGNSSYPQVTHKTSLLQN